MPTSKVHSFSPPSMDDDDRHLLSIFITLSTLTLIYFPSPLLLASLPLLLILLRTLKTLDSSPPVESLHHDNKLENGVWSKSNLVDKFNDPFVEWDVRAPLEVIYEEESEKEESENSKDKETTNPTCLTRHSSLSKYFPETDSETTSSDEYPDWDDSFSSPGKICFMWDEDDPNGLIEIELDDKKDWDFEMEDSVFEIDISSASCTRIPAS